MNLSPSSYTAKEAFKQGPSSQYCLENSIIYRQETGLWTGTVCAQVCNLYIIPALLLVMGT